MLLGEFQGFKFHDKRTRYMHIYIYCLRSGLSGGGLLIFFFFLYCKCIDGCLVGSGVWLSVFNSRMWFEVVEHVRRTRGRVMGYLFVAYLMSYVRRISGLLILCWSSQIGAVSTRISRRQK